MTDDPAYLQGVPRWKDEFAAYQPPVMRHVGGPQGLTAGHILLAAAIMYDMLKGRVDEEPGRRAA